MAIRSVFNSTKVLQQRVGLARLELDVQSAYIRNRWNLGFIPAF
jgi:hypothetical protein